VGRGTLEKLGAIQQGELSATENVQQALDRIKKLDKKIKAFIELNPNALAEAEAVDRKLKRGELAGKLAGLTIGIKSNINVKGLRATCASRTLEDYVSPFDTEVIRRVREARGIIVGMNNMDEFACGSSVWARIRAAQLGTRRAIVGSLASDQPKVWYQPTV